MPNAKYPIPNEIVNIYKPQGLTPLQLIEQFRKDNPEYKDVKIGFAGRLDPLAHGVMLLTVGEANKDREQYLNLNKTYRFKVLFGVETDTYDYLGILKNLQILELPKDYKDKVRDFIKRHTGKYLQPYPPFSSKTLSGTPLFKLAKKKGFMIEDLRFKNGEMWPNKEVEVFGFKEISEYEITTLEMSEIVLQNLKKIKGFFRQKRIIGQWEEFFKLHPQQNFKIMEFEIDCTSGTYVRSLAHKLGQELGSGAIAFEIFRIKVGEFGVEDFSNADIY